MTAYLYEVTFNLDIDADSEEEAEEKATEFERRGWTAIVDDIDVWGSSIDYKGIDTSGADE